MDYIEKPNNIVASNIAGTHSKPCICPYCGIGTDATVIKNVVFDLHNNTMLLARTCKCTSCEKIFFYACYRDKDEGDNAPMVCIYPNLNSAYKDDTIEKFSPRFIDMYNQSLRAESRNDIELAATGYRSALEFLVKDYAIKELGEPEGEVITYNLNNAIGKYLKQEDLANSADVIRVLGNDFTHYVRNYPQHDFEILKDYMDIFITLIIAAYKAKHPPVGRNVPKE